MNSWTGSSAGNPGAGFRLTQAGRRPIARDDGPNTGNNTTKERTLPMLTPDSKPAWWDHHQTNWSDLPVTTNPPMADLDLLKELEDLAELVLIHTESVSWFHPFLPPVHWENEPTIWEQMNGDAVVGLLRDYLTEGDAA